MPTLHVHERLQQVRDMLTMLSDDISRAGIGTYQVGEPVPLMDTRTGVHGGDSGEVDMPIDYELDQTPAMQTYEVEEMIDRQHAHVCYAHKCDQIVNRLFMFCDDCMGKLPPEIQRQIVASQELAKLCYDHLRWGVSWDINRLNL